MDKVVEDRDFAQACDFFENPNDMLEGGAVEVITKDNVYFKDAPMDDAIALREIYQTIIPGFTNFSDYDLSLDEAVEAGNAVILLIDNKANIFEPANVNQYQREKIEEFRIKIGALKREVSVRGGENLSK